MHKPILTLVSNNPSFKPLSPEEELALVAEKLKALYRPTTTIVEGHGRFDVTMPLPPIKVPGEALYAHPRDVPVPLRHNLRLSHGTGLSAEHLAMIYDIPQAWIEMFIAGEELPER